MFNVFYKRWKVASHILQPETLDRIYICSEPVAFLLFSMLGLEWKSFVFRLNLLEWPNVPVAAHWNIKRQPRSVSYWLTLRHIGGGTGEHTFPGQLASQGCRGPAAVRPTLVQPDQTERDLERQQSGRICALKELGNIMCSCLAIYHSTLQPYECARNWFYSQGPH